MNLGIQTLKVGPERTNCYIVSDESGRSFIVDPGSEPEKIIKELEKIKNLDLKYILLTHGHYDHVQAVDEIKNIYPNADVIIGEGDIEFIRKITEQGMYVGKFLKNIKSEVVATAPDQFWPFGEYEIKAIATPGHTPGGFSYLVDGNLFSGDTLFWHTIGRTDLPRASEEKLKDSLDHLMTLSKETKVLPGHGNETTIAEEKMNNPHYKPNYL